MTPTQILMDELKKSYPELDVQLVSKDETAFVDDEGVAQELISISVDDETIVDFKSSSCGRFKADPVEDYGITMEFANRINLHNGIPDFWAAEHS